MESADAATVDGDCVGGTNAVGAAANAGVEGEGEGEGIGNWVGVTELGGVDVWGEGPVIGRVEDGKGVKRGEVEGASVDGIEVGMGGETEVEMVGETEVGRVDGGEDVVRRSSSLNLNWYLSFFFCGYGKPLPRPDGGRDGSPDAILLKGWANSISNSMVVICYNFKVCVVLYETINHYNMWHNILVQ